MKTYRPLTSALRQLCLIDHAIFSKIKLIHIFNNTLKNTAGRNHHGHITVRHKGSGVAKIYTKIDMYSRLFGIPFTINSIYYDAYRSAFISLVLYQNGIISYRALVYKTFIDNKLMSHCSIPNNMKNGDSCIIKYITPGTILCNIELYPYYGAQLSKSAGCSSLLLKIENEYASIRLRSGKVLNISMYCMAFIGAMSNKNLRYVKIGKAGRNRWLGNRPTVRGVAMNPVDHPHGGGEGKKSKRSFPRTPWGKQKKLPSIRLLFK
jgi:large subunit ribosomal protein L2